MGNRHAIKRLSVLLGAGALTFAGVVAVGPTAASAQPTGTVVSAMSTSQYGSVLVVGGDSPLAGAPLYEISSDTYGKFGCNPTPLVQLPQGPTTCTGPTSDIFNNVFTDEWPSLDTTGAPVAGPGVNQALLGSVYRAGIGYQVTYAGHPLYLFDPPSDPFMPQGQGFLETVGPFLPPWHGLWDLVSATNGNRATGQAVIEPETLPDGTTALSVEEYPNAVPGGVAVTVYAFTGFHNHDLGCNGPCRATWIPVLTDGAPLAADGVSQSALGVISSPQGWQVTFHGNPLYIYSQEQPQIGANGPLNTGTVGNGEGLSGPHGGTFYYLQKPPTG